MILRKAGSDVIAIPQPAHAALAGQMARTWGNEMFAPPEPFEAFCLAAEQHDIAWLETDQRPELDPVTGTARQFWSVPAARHTALWREGVRRATCFGRYPALLISLHGITIYDLTFDPAKASPGNIAAVERFRAEQSEVQRTLLHSLRAESSMAEVASPRGIARNRKLLLGLDTMSLHACWGLTAPVDIADLPAAGMARAVTLRPTAGQPDRMVVDPWPFGPDELRLVVEGRRLSGTFPSQSALDAAWDCAVVETLEVCLRP